MPTPLPARFSFNGNSGTPLFMVPQETCVVGLRLMLTTVLWGLRRAKTEDNLQ
jgi:hypothetical protein